MSETRTEAKVVDCSHCKGFLLGPSVDITIVDLDFRETLRRAHLRCFYQMLKEEVGEE